MISRIWKGWTTARNASAYEAVLRDRVLPEFEAAAVAGYRGAHVLRREHDGGVEFMTVMWFDSEESLRPMLGDDVTRAHITDEARAVLGRFEERVSHYEVVMERGAGH